MSNNMTEVDRIDRIVPQKDPIEVCKAKNLLVNYAPTIAPPDIQRPEAWSDKDKKAYFISFLLNRCEGAFTFADLIKASQRIQVLLNEYDGNNIFQTKYYQESLKYFSKWDANYLTLDGNNRFLFLEALFNDAYTIPKGKYNLILNGKLVQLVIGPHNNLFSKLTSEVKHELEERQVVVNTYVQTDMVGLGEIFRNVNAGVYLNRQELRNSFYTPWAEYIRSLRSEFAPLLSRLFSNPSKRLKGDEFILDTLIFSNIIPEGDIFGIGQPLKDKTYYTYLSEENVKEVEDNFSIIQEVINNNDILEAQLFASSVANVFWLITNYEDEITPDLVKEFFKLNYELYTNKDVVNEVGDTFRWACGGTGAKNNELKIRELTKLLEVKV